MKKGNSFFSIKSWSIEDRPREKLLVKGISSLSKTELVAILIGSGNKDESAVDLSKRILASVDFSLHELGKLTVKKIMKLKVLVKQKRLLFWLHLNWVDEEGVKELWLKKQFIQVVLFLN